MTKNYIKLISKCANLSDIHWNKMLFISNEREKVDFLKRLVWNEMQCCKSRKKLWLVCLKDKLSKLLKNSSF